MLRYYRHAPAPFVYLAQVGGAGSVPAAQLARSTLRGLQLLPQLQWPVAAALPALLQHAEPDVRWCAAQCAALVFGLQDASCAQVRPAGALAVLAGAGACLFWFQVLYLLHHARPPQHHYQHQRPACCSICPHPYSCCPPAVQLVQRVLSEKEALQCQLRWDNERAMIAAELAVMYSSSSSSSEQQQQQRERPEDDAMDATPTPSAAPSRDSGGSRKRKLSSGSDDSDADTHAGSGAGGMAPARGYVEVCGLELPQRQAASGGSGGGGDSTPPLVHTPAVDRNLEAVALGEQGSAWGAAAAAADGIVAWR